MSSNQDTQAARSYHEATKLSYINLRTKPSLYKSSEGQPMVPLPQELSTPEMPTLDALSTSVEGRGASLDLAVLGRLLYYSSGLIRKATLPSAGEVHYRAAASAGALYPIEAYVVCGDLPDLPAGVYRFSPEDMGLYRVREGDHRGWLSRAMGEGDLTWEAALVFTAVFWRSAWKYRARSYRYCFWDNGTVLANLLAAGAALRVRSRVSVGFVDEDVNGLLGLTGEREAVLCVARLGSGGNSPQIWESGSEDLAQVRAESAAGGEIVYPEMRDLHAASSLGSPEDVREWQGSMEAHTIPPRGPLFPLGVSGGAGPSSAALGEVIQGRGSTRRFAREDISGAQLSALIHASTRSLPADFRGPGAESLLYVYLIVNAVEGLPAGSYVMTPERDALEVLDEGKFRSEAGHLCFEQALGRRRFRGSVSNGRSGARDAPVRQPGVQGCPARGWSSRRENLSGDPLAGTGGHGAHLLRRRGSGVLLAPCRGQERDVRGRPGLDGRREQGTPIPVPGGGQAGRAGAGSLGAEGPLSPDRQPSMVTIT